MAKKKDSVVEQAYSILKGQIVNLGLRPGQLLMVQQLATELGMSRTPVREALIRLKEENMVDEADGNKFRVSEISWKLIQENYQARMILEEAAIRYIAQHASEEQTRRLEEVAEAMQRAKDTTDYALYFEMDTLFHKEIVRMTGNSILVNWAENTADHQQRIRYCTMGLSSELEVSLAEHWDMVKYIQEKNPEQAAAKIHSHLVRALSEMLKLQNGAYLGTLALIS